MTKLKMRLLGLTGAFLMLYSLSSLSNPIEITIADAPDPAVDGTFVISSFYDSFQEVTLSGQPWYGNAADAEVFAIALGQDEGTPNTVNGHPVGPIFAYGCESTPCAIVDGSVFDSTTGAVDTGEVAGVGDVETYATASRVPEPATLALMGLGLAGVGFTRRKRKS